MAEVGIAPVSVPSRSEVSLAAQFRTVAWLRWRIWRNGFRRKGGVGNLVANLLLTPLAIVVLLAPTAGLGIASYFALRQGSYGLLLTYLWITFAISQFANIQLGRPDSTFDPRQLIRFPLSFRGYAALRVFFGLVAPANVMTTGICVGMAIGMSIALPALAPVLCLAMALYACANIAFTRALFIWVDRWLSTRRAREIFGACLFLFSIAVQWVNVNFNPGFNHGHAARAHTAARAATAARVWLAVKPFADLLPPGLTQRAIVAAKAGHIPSVAWPLVAVCLWTAAFFAIFGFRVRQEFRGETLSEAAAAPRKVAVQPAAAVHAAAIGSSAPRFSAGNAISAVLGKEWITLRRNSGLFYGLIAPLLFVLLFAGRLATHAAPGLFFAGAAAYSMLGVAPLSYNGFGTEEAGIQFFFFAPVRMRDVFVAKNIIHAGLAAAELLAVFIAIAVIRRPPPVAMTFSVVLWVVFTIAISMAVGNRRSITAPKRLDPNKPAGKQASPLSALLAMGLLLLCAAAGLGVYAAALFFGQLWIIPVGALVFAAVGVLAYLGSLRSLDALLAQHREGLIELLAKAG